MFFSNIYVFFLLSASMTNTLSYFIESSSIIYIAWVGVAIYTLFKFVQYNGDNNNNDDDDDKEKKKKLLFKLLCFSTMAALTIITVMSWKNHPDIRIDEIISSSVDVNKMKDDVNITYDLSQYITEDMKVDKSNWNSDFYLSNIDYDHLEIYTEDQLRQLLDAYDNDLIPYNKDLCNKVADYLIDHY